MMRDGDDKPARFKHSPESWKPSITSGCAVGIFAQDARKNYRRGNHVLPSRVTTQLLNWEIVTQTIIFWHNVLHFESVSQKRCQVMMRFCHSQKLASNEICDYHMCTYMDHTY